MKKNWLIAGIIVIVIAGGALALTHKSSDNANTTSNGYNTPSSQSTNNTSSSQSSSTPAASADIVTTKTDPSAGEYLADSSGKPLYTYGADTNGVSNCTGTCLATWPIYAAASSSDSLPTNVTVITRSDGKAQYAYKGMPLYYFASDNGSPTGDGIGNFSLAKP